MKIPRPQTGYQESQYERPNQKWVCGWAAAGRPCRIGPDSKGRCSVSAYIECTPRKEGDRWYCVRQEAFGGPCEQGPMPDGACCKPEPDRPVCEPRLSIRARRARLVFWCVSLAIGFLGLLLGGPGRLDFISPGPLTAGHAGIKPPEGAGHNCAVCHTAVSSHPRRSTPGNMVAARGLQQSAKCLACHFTAAQDTALSVHSSDQRLLDTRPTGTTAGDTHGAPSFAFWLASLVGPPPQTSHGHVPCSTCHTEHQGRHVNLTVMDDMRCQACHQKKFVSFSNGHPVFAPSRARQHLTFNHRLHQKDFGNETFVCQRCHVPDARGRQMRLKPFAQSCTGCHHAGSADHHGKQINQMGTIFVLQLPGMEFEDVYWPSPDVLDVELELPPLMRLLLAGDEQALPALRYMQEGDLLANDLILDDQRALAVELASAIKRLLHDLARGVSLSERITKALAATPNDPSVQALVNVLRSARSAAEACQQYWLPRLADDLAGQTVAQPEAPDEPEGTPNPAGGWQCDPSNYGIVYQIAGHADTFVKACIDAFVSDQAPLAPDTDQGTTWARALRDGLRKTVKASDSFSRCNKCHTIDVHPGATAVVDWLPRSRARSIHTFNKPFEHRPHAIVFASQDASCSHCHQLAAETTGNHSGLLPQRQADCASCHRPHRAQEHCLTCHNYHIRRP